MLNICYKHMLSYEAYVNIYGLKVMLARTINVELS